MKITDEQIIAEVQKHFETKIEKREDGGFRLVSNNFTPNHDLVKEIDSFIFHLRKEND